MDDLLLQEAIERYHNGQMSGAEKEWFEELRTNAPEVDQMVVEHRLLMEELEGYGQRRQFKSVLQKTHDQLVQTGSIADGPAPLTASGRLVHMFHRYKRVTAIAASIAGITALIISATIAALAPKSNQAQIQELGQAVARLRQDQQQQKAKLKAFESKIPTGAILTGGGSAFLIDGKGYLITNAHVLKGSAQATVADNEGQEYRAKIVYVDALKDLALLKIADADYKQVTTLPYTIRKQRAELGEDIFTLGYPRRQVVYSAGYLSALSGYNDDTSSYQISLTANPGNSGGPVFSNSGELVGILSARQLQADGVVFAIKARELNRLFADAGVQDSIQFNKSNPLKGLKRTAQLKKVVDCVYLLKAFQ